MKSIETAHIANEHNIPCQIFYGISDHTRQLWSIVNARRAIGYAPKDNAEGQYAQDIATCLLGHT